jgi:arsenate reductase-like glutaredoxin family protein
VKGKQILYANLKKSKPSADELKALLFGPTGALRAPTLRKGRTLIVGFDEATYNKLLR